MHRPIVQDQSRCHYSLKRNPWGSVSGEAAAGWNRHLWLIMIIKEKRPRNASGRRHRFEKRKERKKMWTLLYLCTARHLGRGSDGRSLNVVVTTKTSNSKHSGSIFWCSIFDPNILHLMQRKSKFSSDEINLKWKKKKKKTLPRTAVHISHTSKTGKLFRPQLIDKLAELHEVNLCDSSRSSRLIPFTPSPLGFRRGSAVKVALRAQLN